MNNSPEFGGGCSESATALSKINRHTLLAELAQSRRESMQNQASGEVARHSELAAMLGRLIESGPELPPDTTAHLRRMIALNYAFYLYNQAATDADLDERFHDMVVANVQSELDEAIRMVGEPLPDLWDIAYQDLMRLEGDTGDQ